MIFRSLIDRMRRDRRCRVTDTAQAERETRWRHEMLAVVAHDLRTPLHTIAVGLETLLKLHPPNDERAARQFVIMQRTVVTMNRLILDLLDVTRIEGGDFVSFYGSWCVRVIDRTA